MFDLEASDPIPLEPGDALRVATEIRNGDVVAFERVGPGEVVLRALGVEAQRSYGGPLYRIGRGERPGSVAVRRTDAG